jgi:type II secretory pathway component GspD/PulD (secretin)
MPALPVRPWLALILLAAAACRGPAPEESGPRSESGLTPDELRGVLAQGTIRPVQELEGEDAFAKAQAEQGEFASPDHALAALEADEKRDALAAAQEGDAPPAQVLAPAPPANPYLTFGERIKVYPDGTITKPYPLRTGTGVKMKQLIESYGNFPMWTPEVGPLSTVDSVKLENLENWDVELYQDLRNATTAQGAPQNLADWLVVTTGYELLLEVEDFINLFAAGVPQIEIEAKIVEITFTDALDLGSQSTLTWPDKTFVDTLASNTPNAANGVGSVLAMSAVQNGLAFDSVLQALATRENVSIISQPKIAVREGGRADILNTTKIPFVDVGSLNNTGGFTAKISYIETGVKLFVVPRVVGTQTVALNIDVEASQQSGNQVTLVSGTAEGSDSISVPIVSTRAAHTVVYLQPGQAVILGGLISERTVERTRKTPILGDIPILGYLFKNKFTAKEQTNVLFFIRPRILQGTDLHREF